MNLVILRRVAACSALGLMAGCGLLDVSDPTTIDEADVANATGADLLRRNALHQLQQSVAIGAFSSGLLADEFLVDYPAFPQLPGFISPEEKVDRRQSLFLQEQEQQEDYRALKNAWSAAGAAMSQLRAYGLEETKQAYVGQMLAVRGFTTLALAEQHCPGFPLNEVVGGRAVFGAPLTTVQAFERALADLDSSVVYAADSARIADGARVGRARALLGLGRFAEAAEAAAPVPTAFVWNMEFTTEGVFEPNPLVFEFSNRTRSVADREGGTGLDFVSASDPRLPLTALGPAIDGVTQLYAIAKYPTSSAPIVLASGIEARLIEAEAALDRGDPSWLASLNELRATQSVPALDALSDPGTPPARLDLLLRERAFWLFATGHRLGDLRRLVRVYGHDSESVFPTGAYRLGGVYGGATSLAFPAASEAAHNPAVTGCTEI